MGTIRKLPLILVALAGCGGGRGTGAADSVGTGVASRTIADDPSATRLWLTAEESERAAKEAALAAENSERAAKEAALARIAELEATIAARGTKES